MPWTMDVPHKSENNRVSGGITQPPPDFDLPAHRSADLPISRLGHNFGQTLAIHVQIHLRLPKSLPVALGLVCYEPGSL
jgi:hypothetical protein